MSVWRRLSRVGKRAAKFKFAVLVQEIQLEAQKGSWTPKKLSISLSRRNRRYATKPVDWVPTLQNPFNGSIVWAHPEPLEFETTLYRPDSSKTIPYEFEDKKWHLIIEDAEIPVASSNNNNKRSVLAAVEINAKDYAALDGRVNHVTLNLQPVSSKKVKHATVHFSISCALIKEGRATDEDMMSLASIISMQQHNNGSLGLGGTLPSSSRGRHHQDQQQQQQLDVGNLHDFDDESLSPAATLSRRQVNKKITALAEQFGLLENDDAGDDVDQSGRNHFVRGTKSRATSIPAYSLNADGSLMTAPKFSSSSFQNAASIITTGNSSVSTTTDHGGTVSPVAAAPITPNNDNDSSSAADKNDAETISNDAAAQPQHSSNTDAEHKTSLTTSLLLPPTASNSSAATVERTNNNNRISSSTGTEARAARDVSPATTTKLRSEAAQNSEDLLNWAQNVTKTYHGVRVTNFTTSWRNGMAFCAIIHHFRPDLIDFESLNPNQIEENCRLAFNVASSRLGMPRLLNAHDMVSRHEPPNKLAIMTYVHHLRMVLDAASSRKTSSISFTTTVDADQSALSRPTQASRSVVGDLLNKAVAATSALDVKNNYYDAEASNTIDAEPNFVAGTTTRSFINNAAPHASTLSPVSESSKTSTSSASSAASSPFSSAVSSPQHKLQQQTSPHHSNSNNMLKTALLSSGKPPRSLSGDDSADLATSAAAVERQQRARYLIYDAASQRNEKTATTAQAPINQQQREEELRARARQMIQAFKQGRYREIQQQQQQQQALNNNRNNYYSAASIGSSLTTSSTAPAAISTKIRSSSDNSTSSPLTEFMPVVGNESRSVGNSPVKMPNETTINMPLERLRATNASVRFKPIALPTADGFSRLPSIRRSMRFLSRPTTPAGTLQRNHHHAAANFATATLGPVHRIKGGRKFFNSSSSSLVDAESDIHDAGDAMGDQMPSSSVADSAHVVSAAVEELNRKLRNLQEEQLKQQADDHTGSTDAADVRNDQSNTLLTTRMMMNGDYSQQQLQPNGAINNNYDSKMDAQVWLPQEQITPIIDAGLNPQTSDINRVNDNNFVGSRPVSSDNNNSKRRPSAPKINDSEQQQQQQTSSTNNQQILAEIEQQLQQLQKEQQILEQQTHVVEQQLRNFYAASAAAAAAAMKDGSLGDVAVQPNNRLGLGDTSAYDEAALLPEFVGLVNKKNALMRREMKLRIRQNDTELALKYDKVQHELRELEELAEAHKTVAQRKRQQMLIDELVKIVNDRAELDNEQDEQEQASENDANIAHQVLTQAKDMTMLSSVGAAVGGSANEHLVSTLRSTVAAKISAFLAQAEQQQQRQSGASAAGGAFAGDSGYSSLLSTFTTTSTTTPPAVLQGDGGGDLRGGTNSSSITVGAGVDDKNCTLM